MRCPVCNCDEDKVIDSRSVREGEGVRRRRMCSKCSYRFTTYESVIHAELTVVKKNQVRVDFEREKIRIGIKKACWKRPISDEQIEAIVNKIVYEIEKVFDGEIPSEVIGSKIMNELKKLDDVAYVRFASVYRQFKDIGQFIDEIKLLEKKD